MRRCEHRAAPARLYARIKLQNAKSRLRATGSVSLCDHAGRLARFSTELARRTKIALNGREGANA
jgi:hypothetical protein